MNTIQIFSNPQFGQIRVKEVNGEPYFVGIDVATALGYEKPHNAIMQHVDLDDSLKQKTARIGYSVQSKRSPTSDFHYPNLLRSACYFLPVSPLRGD